MNKNRTIIISLFISLLLIFSGCKTKEYIEVPVEVEKTKIEYVHKIDSVYLHDSIATYIVLRGDTVFIDRYKYKIKEVFRIDTVHKIDSIPKIVVVDKIVEVNKLHSWQKSLMGIGGIGILGLLIFLMKKFNIWKLLS